VKFDSPLIEGTLLKRYKRFLADVRIGDSGEVIVVHVPNSGSMLGVSDPESPCLISRARNPDRKLPYTLEMVRGTEGSWVGVNTSLTNKLVQEAFEKKLIPDWRKFDTLEREIKINPQSRLDFLLSSSENKRKCYVEVKNVSMAKPPEAVFPDAVTERGQKHLRELAKLAALGHQAEILFVVQREDCDTFRPCDEIDPEYGALLRKVTKEKVVARCWSCRMTKTSIELVRELQIVLK
jgi:sugar fermentation stimulation protein A